MCRNKKTITAERMKKPHPQTWPRGHRIAGVRDGGFGRLVVGDGPQGHPGGLVGSRHPGRLSQRQVLSLPDTEKVTGSNPVPPTDQQSQPRFREAHPGPLSRAGSRWRVLSPGAYPVAGSRRRLAGGEDNDQIFRRVRKADGLPRRSGPRRHGQSRPVRTDECLNDAFPTSRACISGHCGGLIRARPQRPP